MSRLFTALALRWRQALACSSLCFPPVLEPWRRVVGSSHFGALRWWRARSQTTAWPTSLSRGGRSHHVELLFLLAPAHSLRGDLVIFRCQLWPQGPPHRERYLLSDFERAHDELLAPYWSLDWLRKGGRPLDMVWSCSVSRLAGEHKMRGVMYLRPGGDSCWHSRDTPETCTHLQYMSLSRSGTHPLPLRVCTGLSGSHISLP